MNMNSKTLCPLFRLSLYCFFLLSGQTFATSRAKEEPLEVRVQAAEFVFVGKLVNKEVEGDWVKAELVVINPLKNTKKSEKVKVIWRAKIGGRSLYNPAVNSQGIALLKDKHEGRYWLRGDKFAAVEKLEKVKALLDAKKVAKEAKS